MLLWHFVLKLEKCLLDVTVHGGFESSLFVIPLQIYPNLSFAFPGRFHWIVILKGLFKMQGVFLVDILDSKTIDY